MNMKAKQPLLVAPLSLLLLLACQFAQPAAKPEVPTQTQESALQPAASTFEIVEVVDDYGAPMVFVPEGEFTMGVNIAYTDNPVHPVFLDEFYFDKYEVTNARYAECVHSGNCDLPRQLNSATRQNYYGNPEFDNYPVLAVDYEQAKIYCAWRGAHLPTEAQWEKAARGTDQRKFPWGNQSPDETRANYDSAQDDTAEVGSYPLGASPYGALDMAGNVWEWVADWYSVDYLSQSPYSNPAGPESGTMPVVRGGAWDDLWSQLEAFNRRVNIVNSYSNVGFRCARNP